MRAMANSLIHSTTYSELIEKNRRQDKKTKRAKGNYGTARVMNQDVIMERRERQREVLWKHSLAYYQKIHYDVFTYLPTQATTSRKATYKSRSNKASKYNNKSNTKIQIQTSTWTLYTLRTVIASTSFPYSDSRRSTTSDTSNTSTGTKSQSTNQTTEA